MDESNKPNAAETQPQGLDVRHVVKQVLGEYIEMQKSKAEPAYKAELDDERRKREQLERKLNELVEENQRARMRAEEAERTTAIRGELQKLGVTKVDLAFRAVKDDIVRSEDGRLVARDGGGEVEVRDFLQKFVQENPELLPARVTGGSGVALPQKGGGGGGIDLDRIKPGMDPEEMERVRREIARVASQPVKGS
jgi:hypothetical protein